MDPEQADKAPEENSPLKQIRTYQGDVADALEKQRESLVSIQRQEAMRRSTLTSSGTLIDNIKKKREFLMFLLGSLLLISIGVLGAWYGYMEFNRRQTIPLEDVPRSQLLSPTSTTEVDLDTETLTRETLINTLKEAAGKTGAGEFNHILIKEKGLGSSNGPLVNISKFVEVLGGKAPGNLMRAFEPYFMLGASGVGGGQSVFMIMEVSSFENVYSGMLQWERSLLADIGPIFSTYEIARNLTPENNVFTDLTDRNKDIRIISFEDTPILMYSFFGNELLVITDNLQTMRSVLDRLTREKLSR